jgi:hypothetical protein
MESSESTAVVNGKSHASLSNGVSFEDRASAACGHIAEDLPFEIEELCAVTKDRWAIRL